MSHEEALEWIMSQPPGGENFGRRRGGDGDWERLDSGQLQAYDAGLEYIVEVPIHGTRSAYVNDECRCDACRAAEARYRRELRARRRERPIHG